MVDGAEHNVLIHDIDRDPITGTPRHADFYAIVKGQKVEVAVPLEFTGIAPAVKELNGEPGEGLARDRGFRRPDEPAA